MKRRHNEAGFLKKFSSHLTKREPYAILEARPCHHAMQWYRICHEVSWSGPKASLAVEFRCPSQVTPNSHEFTQDFSSPACPAPLQWQYVLRHEGRQLVCFEQRRRVTTDTATTTPQERGNTKLARTRNLVRWVIVARGARFLMVGHHGACKRHHGACKRHIALNLKRAMIYINVRCRNVTWVGRSESFTHKGEPLVFAYPWACIPHSNPRCYRREQVFPLGHKKTCSPPPHR